MSKKTSFSKFLPILGGVLIVAVAVFALVKLVSGSSFSDVQQSESGILLEEAFPENTWFWMSVSTLDEAQREAFRSIVARFTDDPDAMRDLLVEGIDTNLESIDLSYIEDIGPILGTEGVRFAFGLSSDGDGAVVTNAALTLDEPTQAQELLDTLEREGRFVKKSRDEFALYYNVFAQEEATTDPAQEVFYFSLYEDVFLISSNEDQLLNMLNLVRSDDDQSLWTNETYQATIAELSPEHVVMVYVDSQELLSRQQEVSTVSLSASSTDYMKAQGFVLMANGNGLELKGYALGDREKIDADDTGLDRLNSKGRYLFKDIPAEHVMAYFESYNLAIALNDRLAAQDTAAPATANPLEAFLSIPPEDVARFLGEGYSFSVHRNTGFLPGVTLMADVSDGSLTAQGVVDAVDTQISSLIGLFQFQGGSLAEAISKETVELQGGEFQVVRFDVDTVMSLYQATGQAFELPEELKGLQIVILYGITGDDRLILSSYEGWLTDPAVYLTDDADYQQATDELSGYKEGVMFLDFDELLSYFTEFQAFRQALSADAEAIMAELTAEQAVEAELTTELPVPAGTIDDAAVTEDAIAVTDETVEEGVAVVLEPEEEPFDWIGFLTPLKSFAFSSEAGKYEITLGGILLLDEE